MFDGDSHGNHLPTGVKSVLKDFVSTLFRSKADSTVKKYKNEILKFIEWCNLSNVRPVPPFPVLSRRICTSSRTFSKCLQITSQLGL